MENKKISLSFGIVVIAFLVIFYILIKDFNTRRLNDFKEYAASITNVVNQKNNKLRVLYNRLVAVQKENQDLKNTLSETRNSLDMLSKKLAQPAAVVAVPASQPVPATATTPAVATK